MRIVLGFGPFSGHQITDSSSAPPIITSTGRQRRRHNTHFQRQGPTQKQRVATVPSGPDCHLRHGHLCLLGRRRAGNVLYVEASPPPSLPLITPFTLPPSLYCRPTLTLLLLLLMAEGFGSCMLPRRCWSYQVGTREGREGGREGGEERALYTQSVRHRMSKKRIGRINTKYDSYIPAYLIKALTTPPSLLPSLPPSLQA